MTRLRIVISLAILALVVVACASQSASEPSPAALRTSSDAYTQPVEARTVPVELRFIVKTFDGRDFHGQDLMGKSAVLWFWAPPCPACQNDAPMVCRVAASHPAVTFVGIVGPDAMPAIHDFLNKYSMNGLTQVTDTEGTVRAKFGVRQQPAFAFIHPDSRIDVVDGPLTEPDLIRRATDLPKP